MKDYKIYGIENIEHEALQQLLQRKVVSSQSKTAAMLK